MPDAQVVDICRRTLLEVLLLASPILAIAVVVSLTVNVVQVLTSLQEATLSSVPRLLAVAAAGVFHDAVDVAADGPIHREIAFRFSSVREIGEFNGTLAH